MKRSSCVRAAKGKYQAIVPLVGAVSHIVSVDSPSKFFCTISGGHLSMGFTSVLKKAVRSLGYEVLQSLETGPLQ